MCLWIVFHVIDSRRFDLVNTEWTQLMRDTATVPNVIECCERADLYSSLQQLESDLATCQKALTGYIEDKRRTFPRFYFISSYELLDILSKGRNPTTIQHHMINLFENVARLQFHESILKVR